MLVLPRKKRGKIWQPNKEDLEAVVKTAVVLSDILKHYAIESSSGNYSMLKRRLRDDNIDYSHIPLGLNANKGRKPRHDNKLIPLEEILIEHSTYGRNRLKARLLESGMLKNECYECYILPEWNGKPLSLQIGHINGVSDDNRIENLRMLCPNCHAQTDTFGSKRLRGTGKPKVPEDPKVKEERLKLLRKTTWPTKKKLEKLLWSLTIPDIATKFGVGNTTVRRWAKHYALKRPTEGYWQKLKALNH